jgi:hypothetical protein
MAGFRTPKVRGAIFAKTSGLPGVKPPPPLGGNAAIRPPKLSIPKPGANAGFGAQKFGMPGLGGVSKPSGIPGIPSISTANRRSTSRFGA